MVSPPISLVRLKQNRPVAFFTLNKLLGGAAEGIRMPPSSVGYGQNCSAMDCWLHCRHPALPAHGIASTQHCWHPASPALCASWHLAPESLGSPWEPCLSYTSSFYCVPFHLWKTDHGHKLKNVLLLWSTDLAKRHYQILMSFKADAVTVAAHHRKCTALGQVKSKS